MPDKNLGSFGPALSFTKDLTGKFRKDASGLDFVPDQGCGLNILRRFSSASLRRDERVFRQLSSSG